MYKIVQTPTSDRDAPPPRGERHAQKNPLPVRQSLYRFRPFPYVSGRQSWHVWRGVADLGLKARQQDCIVALIRAQKKPRQNDGAWYLRRATQ